MARSPCSKWCVEASRRAAASRAPKAPDFETTRTPSQRPPRRTERGTPGTIWPCDVELLRARAPDRGPAASRRRRRAACRADRAGATSIPNSWSMRRAASARDNPPGSDEPGQRHAAARRGCRDPARRSGAAVRQGDGERAAGSKLRRRHRMVGAEQPQHRPLQMASPPWPAGCPGLCQGARQPAAAAPQDGPSRRAAGLGDRGEIGGPVSASQDADAGLTRVAGAAGSRRPIPSRSMMRRAGRCSWAASRRRRAEQLPAVAGDAALERKGGRHDARSGSRAAVQAASSAPAWPRSRLSSLV